MNVECPSQVIESVGIDEFTNLRIYCGIGQLFRSGTRVGANDRSACRGRSHDDFVAKLGHAVEEADESVYWLEMIAEAKTVDSPRLPPLLAEANELSAILNQSQVTARANQARRRGVGSPIPNPQSKSKFVNS
ncbi:MAG TPA: four helix bundle protein [Vicinamibacterales bacterium]